MLTRIADRRALRRWKRAADAAEALDPLALADLRTRAQALAKRVNRVIQVADGRLQLPLAEHAAIRRPLHADWAWRPEIWTEPVTPGGRAAVESKTPFGREAKIFHDCALSELSIRQIRNTRAEDVAPFGMRLDVFRFDGSFLSLVLDIPSEGIDGLGRHHILRLETRIETEMPLEVFGRLNIRHGPNVEQIVREFESSDGEQIVEFDVASCHVNERRIERAWIDLIFEGPDMNQITLRDVTLSRRPRAEV